MNIGDRVRVVTKWKDDYLFAKEPFRLATYEGTVVKGNAIQDPPGTFNLLTGNPEHPVSIIDFKNVVECEVIGKVKGAPRANRTKYILVRTVKGKEHKVAIHSTGHIACDCVGYEFRQTCSHSVDAQDYLTNKYGYRWTNEVFK